MTSPFGSVDEVGSPVSGLNTCVVVNAGTGPAPSGSGDVVVTFATCPPALAVYAVVVTYPAASDRNFIPTSMSLPSF